MSRLPPPIKRKLLPLWNGGHRVARRAGEYLGAVAHGRFGVCEVCGRFGPRLYRPGVIPPKLRERWGLSPRLASALARKESLDCVWCGAKSRARRLARALIETTPTDPPSHSLAEWVTRPEAKALRVAEVNRIEGIHEVVARLPRSSASDHSPGAGPGQVVGGVRSEDLTRLTYPDGAFDLLLTSETLEHVPDLAEALAEVRRVLAPGGRHVFTVPLLPGVPKTYARALLNPDGTTRHVAPPIFHPGGDAGYPVFTEFGADFEAIVGAAGFEVEMLYGPVTEDDLGQVFVARKPP